MRRREELWGREWRELGKDWERRRKNMADESESKLSVVVNFDNVRFLLLVPFNATVQELRSVIERTAENNYPQLRGKKVQTIKANLPDSLTVHELLQGGNEVFACSSDHSSKEFRRPHSCRICTCRCTANPCWKHTCKSGCRKHHNKFRKMKNWIKKNRRAKKDSGETSKERATNATGGSILPTPPISPAVTKKALISVTGYKDVLNKEENNRPLRKRAIKRSVHKVASWLVLHGEHMSNGSKLSEGLEGTEEESEGDNETCCGITGGQDVRDKEPAICSEQLEGKDQERQSDYACNLRHDGDGEENEEVEEEEEEEEEGGMEEEEEEVEEEKEKEGEVHVEEEMGEVDAEEAEEEKEEDKKKEEGKTDTLSEKSVPDSKLIPTKIVTPATNRMKVSKPPYFPVIEVCRNSVVYFDEWPEGEDESGGMLIEAAVKMPKIVLNRIQVPPVGESLCDNYLVVVRTIATQSCPQDFIKESVVRNEDMQKAGQEDTKSRRNQEIKMGKFHPEDNLNDAPTGVKEVQQDVAAGHQIDTRDSETADHCQAIPPESKEDDTMQSCGRIRVGADFATEVVNPQAENTMNKKKQEEDTETKEKEKEDTETKKKQKEDTETKKKQKEDTEIKEKKEEDTVTKKKQKEDTEIKEKKEEDTETKNTQTKKKRSLLEIVDQLHSTNEGEKLPGGEKDTNKEPRCDEVVSRGLETLSETEVSYSEPDRQSDSNTQRKKAVCEADINENQTVNAKNTHYQEKIQKNTAFDEQSVATKEKVGDGTECDVNGSHKGNGGMGTKQKRKRKRNTTELLEDHQSIESDGEERKQKKKKKRKRGSGRDVVKMEQLGRNDYDNVEGRVPIKSGTGKLIENVIEYTVDKATEGHTNGCEVGKRKRKRERVSAELKAEALEKKEEIPLENNIKGKPLTDLETGDMLENFEDKTEGKASGKKEKKRKPKKEKANAKFDATVEQDNKFVESKFATELDTGEPTKYVRDDLSNEGIRTSGGNESNGKRNGKKDDDKLLDKEGGEVKAEKDDGLMDVQQCVENLEDNIKVPRKEYCNAGDWKKRKREQKRKKNKMKLFEKKGDLEVKKEGGLSEDVQSCELETGEKIKSKDKIQSVSDWEETKRKKKRRKDKTNSLDGEREIERENSATEAKQSMELETEETLQHLRDNAELEANEKNVNCGGKEKVWHKISCVVGRESDVEAFGKEKKGEKERTIKRKRVDSSSSIEDFIIKKEKTKDVNVKKDLFPEFETCTEVKKKKKERKKEKEKEKEKNCKEEKEKEKEKNCKEDKANLVGVEASADRVRKEDLFVKPSGWFQSVKANAGIEEKMFSASESESEPGISMEQVVSRALKASPTKKTDFKTVSKTGNKSKASRSLLDLVEDDASNRPAERRKSFTSSNTTSSLSTPSYVRPFSSPPLGFANVLDRTKQKRKSQQRTTPFALVARRTKPASVEHKLRELTEREKELFRLGSRGLAALLDDDTIWES